MGSMISGLFGGGQSDAQAGQTAALQQASDNAQAYRPEAMQARLNLLSKASGAYQGMNNALETMYGGRGGGKVGGGFAERPGQPPRGINPTFGGHQVPQQPQQPPTQGGPMRPEPRGFDPMSILDPAGIFGGGR